MLALVTNVSYQHINYLSVSCEEYRRSIVQVLNTTNWQIDAYLDSMRTNTIQYFAKAKWMKFAQILFLTSLSAVPFILVFLLLAIRIESSEFKPFVWNASPKTNNTTSFSTPKQDTCQDDRTFWGLLPTFHIRKHVIITGRIVYKLYPPVTRG